jgi:hypothetical protein
MDRFIGVDFDNTLISYDEVMHKVAVQWGLISADVRKSKNDIRDKIRSLPDGEIKWQRLQSVVYGSRMDEAKLIDGVQSFFHLCQKHRATVYIISHKTEYTNNDTGVNLRFAAMSWMKRNRFFEVNGVGLSPEAVYFESTRHEKIERIRSLGCTHFIDDLEETFLEDSFPADVEKILYAPHMQCSSLGAVRVVTSWQEVNYYFFAARS